MSTRALVWLCPLNKPFIEPCGRALSIRPGAVKARAGIVAMRPNDRSHAIGKIAHLGERDGGLLAVIDVRDGEASDDLRNGYSGYARPMLGIAHGEWNGTVYEVAAAQLAYVELSALDHGVGVVLTIDMTGAASIADMLGVLTDVERPAAVTVALDRMRGAPNSRRARVTSDQCARSVG